MSGNNAEVRGLNALAQAFKKAGANAAKGAERGLKKAGLFLLSESQKLVPVDIGNLKASGAVRSEGSGFSTEVRVVYTAGYAVYVHENLDAAHGEWFNIKYEQEIAAGDLQPNGIPYHERGPNQQAKFLEQPYRENLQRIKDIIRNEIAK